MDDPARPESHDLDDALASLRQRVLRGTLNILSLTVPILGAVVVGSSLLIGAGLNTVTISLSLFSLVFLLLRLFSDRLGFRWTAIALLVLGGLTAFFVEARAGIGIGNISMNVLVLVLGALFFGRRGAALSLLMVVAFLGLAAAIVLWDIGPAVAGALWDPSSPTFWIRQLVSLTLFGMAIAATEVYVVEHLAQEAERFRALADREREQRLALERAEREREHEREQRMAAQKALEESRRIESLARLAGGIAHDFNNVLTVILGTAESIEADPDDRPAVETAAREIADAAGRAADMTRQLLLLGRHAVTQPQPVAIAPLLARLASALRRVIPSDIALDVNAPDPSVVAQADPRELERAVFNLVVNARDAIAHNGHITIGCRLEARDATDPASGPAVVLSVADTGPGIAPDVQQRIFDPFFTTKGPGAGTGLGLATVQAFARESGGSIRVISTPGSGATFELRLPVAAPVSLQPAIPTVPGRPVRQGATRVRVLVVEDRDDVRATMLRTLRQGGFDVTEAGSGEGALAALAREGPFDLLCIDGVMPGSPTSAVIASVEATHPHMRILLVSGYLDEDLLRRGVRKGRYAFLQKPFTAEALLGNVHELLSRPH